MNAWVWVVVIVVLTTTTTRALTHSLYTTNTTTTKSSSFSPHQNPSLVRGFSSTTTSTTTIIVRSSSASGPNSSSLTGTSSSAGAGVAGAGPPSPCRSTCGALPVMFPFGIDDGCGSPQFSMYCTSAGLLQMLINSKPFAVRRIDYSTRTLLLADPAMSDCSNLTFDSAGLDLNLGASGLSLAPSSTVLLLNCMDFSQEINFLNSQYDCHNPTCLAFVGHCHNGPLTSCCRVNDPSSRLDLYSMQCMSYTSIYSPHDPLFNPGTWSYGLQLQWSLPSDVVTACNSCQDREGTCGYDTADMRQHFKCICDQSSIRCKGCLSGSCATLRTTRMAVGFSVAGAFIVLTSLLIFIFRLRHKRFKKIKSDYTTESQGYLSDHAPSLNLMQVLATMTGPLPLTLFSHKELLHATASFSDSRLIGDGGYGMVYKAKFCDGRILAVKRLNHQNHRRLEHFYNEVRILSQLKHPNLVQLVGFCLQGKDLLLVYEYVSNGTLEDHIHAETRTTTVKWETRLSIAHQIADALTYLHFSVNPPIFHRDVKSSNILLDDHFQAKLADFGLSRLVPDTVTHISTAPQGTPGYVDPEYHQSYQLTDKSDVYSFGVVLLELISGKRAVDLTRLNNEVNLSAYAIARIKTGTMEELLDPQLVSQGEHLPAINEMIKKVAELAFKCVALERKERPNMKDVADELQHILSLGVSK